ncbi:MAG: Trk system potassium uptake protein TrkG [Candidatus Anoxychlamydiales bacterium]|nr:Trk system potassium uptake protein TrkG [Candidatus Anoxychlamydiales bacterium]NGX36516.1 Trk system potassium uptake protein TrkG [Candidatus Anoxychlamydiales bacterium]
MRYKEVSKIIGKLLFYFSLMLIIPLFISLYFQFIYKTPHPNATIPFLETIAVCLILSGIFLYFGKKASGVFFRRESVLIVVLMWVLATIISALPFYFSSTLTNPIDCVFESMSGLTTTGATVMCPKLYQGTSEKETNYSVKNPHYPEKNYVFYGTIKPVRDASGNILYEGVEAVSKAVLFWRSFIQWLGGLGIVVLFLTVLPALAVGGKFLLQAEMTGPVKETIAPRIKETASLLWKLYLGLTIIEVFFLILTNEKMQIMDAFCITFSNLSTGGYAIRNDSIASYHNYITEWVIIVFMFIGSINFALYFHCLRGKFYKIYEPDFILYVAVVVIGAALVVYKLIGARGYSLDGVSTGVYNLSSAIREGTFQAISAQSSTGFVTTDVSKWPFSTQMFMLLLMFIGGMSGATCGGIKTSRFYILYKIMKNKIEEIFRPSTVRLLKVGKKEIPTSTGITVLVFFCLVAFFTVLATVLFVFAQIDSETSFSSVACMLNNIGFAFGAGGPGTSFAFMSSFSKLLSSFLMLLGRLEYFIIILIFAPIFWKIK